MIFPFTFKFSVPGIINPFALSASSSSSSSSLKPKESLGTIQNPTGQPARLTQSVSAADTLGVQNQTGNALLPVPPQSYYLQPRTPHHQQQQLEQRARDQLRSQSITPPVIISRKRGWDPAFSEQGTQSLSSSSIMTLDASPPSGRERERDTSDCDDDHHEVVDGEELPPPAKRRRGLAGSIVSTALSAALIGTAVGLTVYRLWRDRGKPAPTSSISTSTKGSAPTLSPHTPQTPPPPPYQETERTPGLTTPTKSLRKRLAGSTRRAHYHQSSYPRHRPSGRTRASPAAAASEGGQSQPEDQMDWIGDKLSALIAEGKRALGAEIVVMSDAKEDEVDDGTGVWEDDGSAAAESLKTTTGTHSRSSSSASAVARRSPSLRSPRSGRTGGSRKGQISPRKPGSDACSTGYFDQPSPYSYSPCLQQQLPTHLPTQSLPSTPPRRTHTQGLSLDSASPASAGHHGSKLGWTNSEDVSSYESPELRETMERARQRALMMRAAGSPLRGAEV